MIRRLFQKHVFKAEIPTDQTPRGREPVRRGRRGAAPADDRGQRQRRRRSDRPRRHQQQQPERHRRRGAEHDSQQHRLVL